MGKTKDKNHKNPSKKGTFLENAVVMGFFKNQPLSVQVPSLAPYRNELCSFRFFIKSSYPIHDSSLTA